MRTCCFDAGKILQSPAHRRAGLQVLQRVWLAKTPFLAGDQITIADLQVCAELEQLKVLYGLDLVRLLAALMACKQSCCDHPLMPWWCRHLQTCLLTLQGWWRGCRGWPAILGQCTRSATRSCTRWQPSLHRRGRPDLSSRATY